MSVRCDLCGKETDTEQNIKHQAKDGVICDDCYQATGLSPSRGCLTLPLFAIKKQIDSNDGLTINDRNKNPYMDEVEQRRQPMFQHKEERPQPQDETVKCPKCGSPSLSANKQGFGVGKAVVGAAVFGSIGLVAGNIGKDNIKITCMNCGHQWMAGQK